MCVLYEAYSPLDRSKRFTLLPPSYRAPHMTVCFQRCPRVMTTIYIYNSVCARRHKHINFAASAQLNATQIAVMKGSHWRPWMDGPEIIFSIYQCCFLAGFSRSGSIKRFLTQLTSTLRRSAGGTRGGPI